MGFDITFHPISERELQRFVFDVIDTPSILDERLAELCPDPDARQEMRKHFETTLPAIEEERLDFDDGDEDYEDDEDRPPAAGNATRWLAAAVSNSRHPYWYSRGAGLRLARYADGEAPGFITPAGVREIAARINAKDPVLVKAFGGVETERWKWLRLAIEYAESRGLGLIEADSFTVGGDMVHASEPVNLRPDFMKYVEVDGDIEPRNPTKAMRFVRIGVGILLLIGGRVLIESGVSLTVFIGVLLAILIAGRIAMRELSSRAND